MAAGGGVAVQPTDPAARRSSDIQPLGPEHVLGLTNTRSILGDARSRARRRLPRMVFDYLDGAAGDESGLAANRQALQRIVFAPRRLVDVVARETGMTLFGRPYKTPLVIAPIGLNGVFWPGGDIALARAAARAEVPFCLSTAANSSIEAVARASDGEKWFQLYVIRPELADSLVDRAMAAGYAALVVTVDVAVNGRRERDARNGFAVPFRYSPRAIADVLGHPTWLAQQLRHGFPRLANLESKAGGSIEAQAALMKREMDASFDWDDLARLRDRWTGPLVVKGLLGAEDVARCARIGCDAVVLSNHGARQLASVAAPIDVLRIAGKSSSIPLLVDSGYRDGADVVKALALGARAVMLGRPVLYGLAAGGADGAFDVIDAIAKDVDRTLALIGCRRIADLDETWLEAPRDSRAI